MNEYSKNIKRINAKYTTDKHLKKEHSKSIMTNECPWCEFEWKCYQNSRFHINSHLCIRRSTETLRVWLYSSDKKPKIEVGETYGFLTVLEFSHKDKNRKLFFSCICKCGRKINARSDHLISGNTTSCGCMRGKSNKMLTSGTNTVSKCGEKETCKGCKIGSVVNPDGTRHVVSTEHHSKVGCKVDKLVTVEDKQDPHNPETNYHYFIDDTCYVCGGLVRTNSRAEQECENCNTIQC